MRVLYFSRDYTTHDRRFLAKFAETEHDVYFLRLENDGIEYEGRDLPDGIHEVVWPGGKEPKTSLESWLHLIPSLEQVISSVKPDIIHAGPVQSCGFMTALTGFQPFMAVSWGSDILVEADRNELWRWITQFTLHHSSMFLCDCDAVRIKARQLVEYSEDCIVQFPWGVDLAKFHPGLDTMELRSSLNWQDAIIFLSTRTWEPIYGIDILLNAFQKAHNQESRLRLVLLGSGSLSDYVERFLSDHDLSSAVFRPGMIPHSLLPDFFRVADSYVTSAHSDGTSISLLEAMATGLSIVASDSPGNREWLINRRNGWLYTASDANSATEAILDVASLSVDRRREIAEINRNIVKQKADWDANFLQLMRAYDELEKRYYQ